MSFLLTRSLKKLSRNFGFDIVRYPSPDLHRRIKTYQAFNITTLVDVGANAGQYAALSRNLGYKGEIISFEPTASAFYLLTKLAAKDEHWKTYRMAIGARRGQIDINISENSFSSSILDIKAVHLANAPLSRYIAKESVPINTLANLFDDLKLSGNIFLKIDTQGYETEVLKGAERVLPQISCIQLEMGLIELYEGEKLFEDILAYLKSRKFEMYTIEPEFYDISTGQLLQVDAIFYKK
ncbi:MAG: FkbM family methyltransferase [Chitinophagaceae bacterium]